MWDWILMTRRGYLLRSVMGLARTPRTVSQSMLLRLRMDENYLVVWKTREICVQWYLKCGWIRSLLSDGTRKATQSGRIAGWKRLKMRFTVYFMDDIRGGAIGKPVVQRGFCLSVFNDCGRFSFMPSSYQRSKFHSYSVYGKYKQIKWKSRYQL